MRRSQCYFLKVLDTDSSNPLFCLGHRLYVECVTALDMGRMNVCCEHCGALHWLDERQADSSVQSPKIFTCCANGKVLLPPLREQPPPLLQLYTEASSEATEFRDNIVQYNSALAFMSVGVSIDLYSSDCRGFQNPWRVMGRGKGSTKSTLTRPVPPWRVGDTCAPK